MPIPIPFPDKSPPNYELSPDEPEFNPDVHLALEMPSEIVMLTDLGYSKEEIASKATRVAASSPFRVLSDEGASVLLESARRSREHARSCDRIDNMSRGGCYRSRFLRDLCLDESVSQLMSEIYQIEVAPHPMPVQLGHMNFSPNDYRDVVDKWHHDTLPLDYVMMVTDPATVAGGEFQYFLGTKADMAALQKAGKKPIPDQIVSPEFPGPGYAIALHGDMVVHRGAALTAPCERISMVNGYVTLDTSLDYQSRNRDLINVDDHETLFTEWARYVAWRTREKLDSLIQNIDFNGDRTQVAQQLEEALVEANEAVSEMRDESELEMHHYE